MLFVIEPFCQVLLVFGILIGSIFQLLLSVLLILHFGPFPLLVSWLSGFLFWLVLHWPAGGSDLGVGGISYLELLISYELWAGERLSLEKATPRYLRPERSISVSAVPFGPGIDIWRSCRLIGASMRSLCLLPGGLGRFVTCSIGANPCRLRHIGWEKCGHGLTSRPRESASVHFLDELLALFRYPSGSGRALLAGTLPLRYCSTRFACMTPLGGYQFMVLFVVWLLLILMLVVGLLLMRLVGMFFGLVVLVRVGNEFDETEKLLHTLRGTCLILVLRFGRGCVRLGFQESPCLITLGGVVIMLMGALFMSMTELV